MSKNLINIIEITDTHVKWLQGRQDKGKPVIVSWDVQPISTPSDEDVSRILKFMGSSKGKKIDAVTGVLPRRFVILKSFRFPSKDEEEIRKMVSLQLVQQIPYGLEDIIFKTQIIDKEPSGYTRVNVFVVHKEVAGRYFQVFEKAGLTVGALVLSSQGLAELVAAKDSKDIQAYLHLDAGHSEICFTRAQHLIYSRHIALGVKDMKGDLFSELVNQVAMSFQSLRKEQSVNTISSLTLLTSFQNLDQLQNDLKVKIQATVNLLDPLGMVSCPVADKQEASMGVCLGFLKSKWPATLNFIPPQTSAKRESVLRKNQLAQLGISLLILFVLLAGVFFVKYQAKKSYLTILQEQNSQQQESLLKARQQMGSVDFFKQELKDRVLVADLVEEVLRLIPSDVSLRALQFDSSGAFSIQGYAQEGPGVNMLQEGMARSAFFKEVNLQFATKRRIFDRDVTDFKITASLKSKS
jgi:Tfp pilus assembly PilM family ATPase